ncbi:transmembrane protein 156 isoform X1 [Bufo gargarizans]|uniref:transmembrane protein 156 isoform X1 n=2 Tax=Bufo gargarizans TaxID=30331 RepID=UPI001CF25D49|nr:transmembrane protein 156 isoform X1 [Bufo gargarizans]
MAASLLLKLCIGITVLLIVCIPEWFKTEEGISVDLSCIDPCMVEISYTSSVTGTPIICLLQGNESKDVIENATAQNAILSSITLDYYMNNAAAFICDPQRNTHPLSEEMNAQGKPINISLIIRGRYFYYSEVKSNFDMVESQEDEDLSVPSSLEIYISNQTEHNGTMDQLYYQDSRVHHDFINVSLHFNNQILFYRRPFGIVWLILISLVFACGLIFIVYKIKEEKNTRLRDYNHERSSMLGLKEHINKPSKTDSYDKNDQTCKHEKWKNQNCESTSFLPIIAEQHDSVCK